MRGQEQALAVDRRALLRAAILLVGGAAAGHPQRVLAQPSGGPAFFTKAEFEVLGEVADIIIPRTQTPGARDAGVPEAIDALMINWASPQRQAQFRGLVQEFGGAGLLSLPQEQRIELVRSIDAAKLGAADPVYTRFKELVLTVYYLSEAGATKELRFELIPGKWEPWTEMAPDERAWAI